MHFLDHFVAPALQRLDLCLFERGWSTSALCEFIVRSRCDLTQFTIQECTLRGADLPDILLLVPNLRGLSIQHASPNTLTSKLMGSLTLRHEPHVLPKLETLHIDGWYLFRDEVLLSLLESRAPTSLTPCLGLNTMELVLRDREFTPSAVERLRALPGVYLALFCLNGQKNLERVVGDFPSR
ncbi:hypothetical protein B0H19DRAFT_1268663 [Mycena capillaripes]|nr:hypothetical protein B0H19DRAFT_1268663 [Mycena capillaripes]